MAMCMSVHWVINFFVGLLFLRSLEANHFRKLKSHFYNLICRGENLQNTMAETHDVWFSGSLHSFTSRLLDDLSLIFCKFKRQYCF
ncbi:hypothetical protein J5N97_027705 [Dioscorea zingiberensis]|uniref:Secreted protein n=1 Tax=Dioscorea zingiberensis TaxID=325984 RepID=A0A9D5H446_9LILI|nr:hypothetical protein J5N97_027705 [Dioscorea zingiberensis]